MVLQASNQGSRHACVSPHLMSPRLCHVQFVDLFAAPLPMDGGELPNGKLSASLA